MILQHDSIVANETVVEDPATVTHEFNQNDPYTPKCRELSATSTSERR